jgi:hypothetical protein
MGEFKNRHSSAPNGVSIERPEFSPPHFLLGASRSNFAT